LSLLGTAPSIPFASITPDAIMMIATALHPVLIAVYVL